jgi:phospholipid/cholesterol/gamma-HCH transport system ATP-binding protein
MKRHKQLRPAQRENMSIIQLRDVVIRFGPQVVLENINLEIRKGECLVLVGPSGQGKTSLLKTLAGLISPQKGDVFVEQKNLLTLSKKEKVSLVKKMGMLFQKNALFDSLTCADNIAFPLRETGAASENEICEKVDYFLDQVGLPHVKELFPDEISGGMQKRLGIARALALDPEIIFYDDPTAGLDPITSRKIVDLILRLKKEKGSTVVAITNDMNRAYQLADRIGVVVDKELIITGNAEQTKNHQDPRVHQFVRGSLQGPLSVDANAGQL